MSKRPMPFILVSSNHGTLIVNRNDRCTDEAGRSWGVGHEILETGSHDRNEVGLVIALLERRRHSFGDGVVMLDCGANIGVHTVECARAMHQWGEVHAFEAQEKIFYALAGNVMINNCLNASVKHCALGATCGFIEIPEPNYCVPGSFGSLELKRTDNTEFIGQEIDYTTTRSVPLVSIDSLGLKRVDLLKIDVERMEIELLRGAAESIAKHRPILFIEILKTSARAVEGMLAPIGYNCHLLGAMLLAVHADDPIVHRMRIQNGVLTIGDR